jgi:hypothetical protein
METQLSGYETPDFVKLSYPLLSDYLFHKYRVLENLKILKKEVLSKKLLIKN